MSDAQCHFGCTILTEIQENSLKVVRCWYGNGPLMFGLRVSSSGEEGLFPLPSSSKIVNMVDETMHAEGDEVDVLNWAAGSGRYRKESQNPHRIFYPLSFSCFPGSFLSVGM